MDPFEQLWGPPKANAAGPLTMNLIKGFEGYAPVAKWDVRQHSGGYGSRAKPGEQFTPEIAEQRLGQEVAPINAWLDKNITQPLSPERRAAFNSFGYNLGVDDLEKLKPDINRGDWSTVGNRMLSFNKALNEKTGQLEPLAGLTTRRQKEAAMITGGAAPQESAQMPMMPQQRQQGPLASAMSGLPNSMVPGILGGGDEPGYFGKLLSDPTFLTGASVLGAGLSGQDFGTALSRGTQGAQAQSEMFDKRRKAVAWQKMWGQNGQPNAESPLLKGVPPEVLPIIQQMGPEDGMRALQQIAMKRLEPRQLTPVSPGATLYDERQGQAVFTAPDKATPQKFEFTKYGIGDPSSGDIRPYPKGTSDPEFTLEQGKHEQSLRKEYTSLSADMRVIQDGVAKMRKASTLDSGAGDIATVYSYMKMLDPTSVVREGEYATAENTGGLPEKVWNLYNKALTGQRLTPGQRAEFLGAGEALAAEKGERFGKLRGQFEGIARRSGADPQHIMLDEGAAGPPPVQPGAGAAPGGTPARLGPNDKAIYDAMPSGTPFIDPEGNPRTKP
jgi:GH24 family phage-related lysozyme (muramidase)